ncbi:glycosyltransferase family 2 protein [Paenibacillus lautus]|uniref:glycosyltransferase family 2 protein n=1 Tax=Paenibacillus lautus TaxID=1401 RepID=UPI00398802F1
MAYRSSRSSRWERLALRAGSVSGRGQGVASRREASLALGQWLASSGIPPQQLYLVLPGVAEAFRRGFAKSSRQSVPAPLLPPLAGRASVIVSACNEAGSIPMVLRELKRLPFHEIIVVENGSHDHTFAATRAFEGVTVIHTPERLGHDVARAVGAKMSTGDIVLFMDGDMPVPAEKLSSFLVAADRGVDVALNDIMPLLPSFGRQDEVTRCKAFLNRMLGRDELEANSLTAVPHAMTRQALDSIGYENLSVPPMAQTLAIRRGLRIEAVHTVDVLSVNRKRRTNRGKDNPVAKLIIGDHIEALGEMMKDLGPRLQWGQVSRTELALRRNSL